MSNIKLGVVGMSDSGAKELETVIVNTLGNLVETQMVTLNDHTHYSNDIYVCFKNREQECIAMFGEKKVIALELRAPAMFFIQVAQIPAGESVIVFNNSQGGADVILKYLSEYRINQLNFEVVAFEKLSDDITREKLSHAKYIIGNSGFTAEGTILYTKYGSILPHDVVVISSPTREATPDSVSHLARKVIIFSQDQDRRALLLKQAYRINDSISHIAATIEELNASQENLAVSMHEASSISEKASKDVSNTREILQVIRHIASETNLLGLNAAIEAARAGNMGRGFAVVADEIRKLSVQSSDSAKTIGEMLEQMKSSIDIVIHNTQQTATITHEQFKATQSITEMINELQQVSEEMLRSSEV